jgi:hypothetical protein
MYKTYCAQLMLVHVNVGVAVAPPGRLFLIMLFQVHIDRKAVRNLIGNRERLISSGLGFLDV